MCNNGTAHALRTIPEVDVWVGDCRVGVAYCTNNSEWVIIWWSRADDISSSIMCISSAPHLKKLFYMHPITP